MRKQVAICVIIGGIMSVLVSSCAQKKNEKPNDYNQDEKKQGCGCSLENILDLRASEHSNEGLPQPTAKL